MISEILILAIAIPVGYLIAWLAKDEIVSWRKWFKVLIISSVIVGIIFYFYEKPYISWTAGFILIVSSISLMQSQDKKWIRKI